VSALWDWVTGKTEAEGQALDDRLDQLNARRAPVYGEAWAAEVETNRGRSSRAIDYDAQIEEEFSAGALSENLKESAASAGNAVGSVTSGIVNAAASFTWRAIPLPVWILALGFLFFWSGGPVWLPKLIKIGKGKA
jgi:hypothetical protein